MKRLLRYGRLWLTLPDEERRMRAGRLLERALRRRPVARRLGLSPDQPYWWRLRRALRVDLDEAASRLGRADPRRGPLHADLGERAAAVARRHPDHAEAVLDQTRELLQRRFDLLGSGPARPLLEDGRLDWHRDWKSGLGWDPGCHHREIRVVRGDGSDVKLPWELSRFQHLLVLGQAYLLAPHLLPEEEAVSLRSRCGEETVSQVTDWIERNPRGLGVNWACTMDVAIRAVNWLAAIGLFRGAPELDPGFLRIVLRSLWVHGRHIRRNLEIGGDGLTSNHYLSDVLGLYALGSALPELREASGWAALGRRALVEEMERQVLPDGVDFERSIPYHRLVAELFLHGALIARCRGEEMPGAYLERLALMLEFTVSYTRPDGSAPQWGDNDDGRLLPLEGYATHRPHDHRHLLGLGGWLTGRADLAAAAGPRRVEALWLGAPEEDSPSPLPDLESRGFKEAGYYVMRAADLHAGIACGPVGTRGVGNHTHNDLASLCLWAGGREWITDPGTGCYSSDPVLRNRMRSTASHATLQLGRREQNRFGSELEDLFLMTGGAMPEVTGWESSGSLLSMRHEGFGTAEARRTHVREVRFLPGSRLWVVSDRLGCPDSPTEEAEPVYLRFPLSPGVRGKRHDGTAACPPALREALEENGRAGAATRRRLALELEAGEGERFWIALDLPDGSEVEVREGLYSPRYGVTEPSQVVVAVLPHAPEVRAFSLLHSPPEGAGT